MGWNEEDIGVLFSVVSSDNTGHTLKLAAQRAFRVLGTVKTHLNTVLTNKLQLILLRAGGLN